MAEMMGSFGALQKSVVSISDASINKAFQITKDPPSLPPFLNGEHELLASIHILPGPKPCVQSWIHPIDLEFLDPVVQCPINLMQSAVTELVDLIEAHNHLNPISISKFDGSWRIDYRVVVLVFEARGIPSRFGEVELSLVVLVTLKVQQIQIFKVTWAKPTEKHLKKVKRIFRYLRGTVNMGLWYTKDSGEKLVSWSSKKQDCMALSTAEAEYMSLSACCTQVLWMRTQLTDYGFHFNKIPIYCDSKSDIAISCNLFNTQEQNTSLSATIS
nr:copia protein [Tanacetum cinerariifolium]